MRNPWLEIPEEDYVAHMSSEDAGQLPVLAELFTDALRPFTDREWQANGKKVADLMRTRA